MIEIHFKKGGLVSVEPKGYPDHTCFEASQGYLEAFGREQQTRFKDDQEAFLPQHEQQHYKEKQ